MEWKLEAKPSLEIYVSQTNKICIKQGSELEPGEEQIVLLDLSDMEIVIDWLQQATDQANQNDIRMHEKQREEAATS